MDGWMDGRMVPTPDHRHVFQYSIRPMSRVEAPFVSFGFITLIARSRPSIFALGAISTMMTFYGVWIIAY